MAAIGEALLTDFALILYVLVAVFALRRRAVTSIPSIAVGLVVGLYVGGPIGAVFSIVVLMLA